MKPILPFLFSLTLFSGAAETANTPAPGSRYQIQDGGRTRVFRIAGDAVAVKSPTGTRLLAQGKIAKTAQELSAKLEGARQQDTLETNLVLTEESTAKSAPKRYLTSKVVVKLKDGTDAATTAAASGAARFESPSYAPGLHIFHCADAGGALVLQEKLRQLEGVESADALLTLPMKRRLVPNDTYYANNIANAGYLWHLKNSGARGGVSGNDLNVETAWNTVRGNGIGIGIIDDGIEGTHADLAANYAPSLHYDFINDSPTPAILNTDTHGTQCAGLAAARGNNGIGVCGVAYEATLHNLRIDLDGGLDDAQIAGALGFENDVIQVKSNSYGPDDTGDLLEGPGLLSQAALADAATNGRDGKGVILVYSAGNGAANGDNANYDGYGNSIYTIAVGGVSDDGLVTDYAEPGANLVVCAPTDSLYDQTISTLDRSGALGDNVDGAGDYANFSYTSAFGGTSACAPQVAGVAALMLQRNPNLGWRDVQEILIKSARQVDASNSDWTTNAGGLRFNHKFGAGLADASAAVALAATWTNLAPQSSLTLDQSALDLTIPDNILTPLVRSFSPGTSLRVEHVVLKTSISHARRGDLRIELVSPSGMTSVLADEREDTNSNYNAWGFSSVRHWGENSLGNWTVRITDRRPGQAGTLLDLQLTIYGTPVAGPSGVPVITSAATATATVGAPFRYQITATNLPTSFAAAGLPAGLSLNPSTGLISGTPTTAGSGNINLTASNGTVNSIAKALTLTRTDVELTSLANAVDAPSIRFTTRGSVAGWARATTISQDGSDSAASGTTGHSQSSDFGGIVDGPAILTFWWSVSSEQEFDTLTLYVDNTAEDSISGEVGWTQVRRYLPPGRHYVEWSFERDETDAGGSNKGWVDQISLQDPATGAPYIHQQPFDFYAAVGNKACFLVEAYGLPPLAYQWKKDGIDIPNTNTPSLLLESASAGTYTCVVSNSISPAATSDGATLTIIDTAIADSLAIAMNSTGLDWGTPPIDGWASQATVAFDGVTSLRSAAIVDDGFSLLQTCVTGPLTMRFQARVSSEADYDFLDLYMDGKIAYSVSGEMNWEEVVVFIPSGTHLLEWLYSKDSSESAGLDAAFLDAVTLEPAGYGTWQTLLFTSAEIEAGGVAGPQDDPEGDGVRNYLEYAFNMDPHLADANAGKLPLLVETGGQRLLRWEENAQLQDIRYIPETSTNLLQWTTLTGTLRSTAEGIRQMEAILPATGPEQFGRIRVQSR